MTETKSPKGKTLNVKPTTIIEVTEKWGFSPPNEGMFDGSHPLFVRCNSDGAVNWEVAPIYAAEELKQKKVTVIW